MFSVFSKVNPETRAKIYFAFENSFSNPLSL